MTVDSPYQWLKRTVDSSADAPCLVEVTGTLSYGQVLADVERRASELASTTTSDEIVPVKTSIDSRSIIEILAVQAAGAVPLPYSVESPPLPVSHTGNGAVCVVTSGSEGVPRIVPLTYGQVAASVHSSRDRLATTSRDRWLLCLPLNHVGGLSIVWRMLEAGGSIAVSPFSSVADALDALQPTVASLVPTMVIRLLASSSSSLADLRFVLVGGARVDGSLVERAADAGVNLVSTYGLTEAGSQVATASIQAAERVPESVGRPLAGLDVRIEESGLVTLSGHSMFSGYLGQNPREEPFVTGDLGHFDREGNLYITGRADDMIVSGGENVFLGEVARAIAQIDGIEDVCVVGVSSAEWGSTPMAMVVSSMREPAVSERIALVTTRSERPKRVIVRKVLPALINGKHDRAAVRAAFEDESGDETD